MDDIYVPKISGRRIIEARAERGMTQTELAKRTGRANTLISKYELGKIRRPDPEVINSIGKILNVSNAWVLGWPDAVKYRQTEDEKKMVNDIYDILLGLNHEQLQAVLAMVSCLKK